MMLFSLAHVVALTLLFGTPVTPVAAVAAIAPHTWEMASFTLGDEAPVEVGDPEQYTAQFLTDGQATFQMDCNRGHADFVASDGQLALTNVATTDALCPSGTYSESFGVLLFSAESYRFDDTGNLILRGAEGSMRLRPAVTGVVWQWQGIADNDGRLVVAITTPERYTLEFLPGEALAIRADCNRARARVHIDGSAMAIRPGGMTRMACLSGSLNDLYLTGLHNVEHWYLFDGVLTLSLPDGMGMMTFNPVVPTRVFPSGAE